MTSLATAVLCSLAKNRQNKTSTKQNPNLSANFTPKPSCPFNVRLTGSEAVRVRLHVKHCSNHVPCLHAPTPIIASSTKNAANATKNVISIMRLALSLSILRVLPSTRVDAYVTNSTTTDTAASKTLICLTTKLTGASQMRLCPMAS